jgi:hypothetical protein
VAVLKHRVECFEVAVAADIADETEKWGKVIRAANITAEQGRIP